MVPIWSLGVPQSGLAVHWNGIHNSHNSTLWVRIRKKVIIQLTTDDLIT